MPTLCLLSASFHLCHDLPTVASSLSRSFYSSPLVYSCPIRLFSPPGTPRRPQTITLSNAPPLSLSASEITDDGAPLSLEDVLLLTPRPQTNALINEVDRIMAKRALACGFEPKAFDRYRYLGLMFSCYSFPSSVSAERLAAVGIHMGLGLLADDLFDAPGVFDPEACGLGGSTYKSEGQIPELWRHLDATFRSPIPPANSTPLERMFWEVGQDMQRFSPPAWFRRLADEALVFIESGAAQKSLKKMKEKSNSPSWAGDLKARFDNAGVPINIRYMELANDLYLPSQLQTDPVIVSLSRLTSRHGLYLNDLCSYHKDVSEGSDFNVVRMLMATEGISVAQASKRALKLIDETTLKFAEIEANLPTWEPEDMNLLARRYVQGLKEYMSGVYAWLVSCKRYRSPDALVPELRAEIDIYNYISALH